MKLITHADWDSLRQLISPDLVMMWQAGNFEYLSITLPFSAIQLNINPFRFQNFLSGTEMQKLILHFSRKLTYSQNGNVSKEALGHTFVGLARGIWSWQEHKCSISITSCHADYANRKGVTHVPSTFPSTPINSMWNVAETIALGDIF